MTRRPTAFVAAGLALGSLAFGAAAAASPDGPAGKPVVLKLKLGLPIRAVAGQSVSLNFKRSTIPHGDKVVSYKLFWGDNSRGVSTHKSLPKSLTHHYGRAGRYKVSVTVTDARHTTSRAVSTIIIRPVAVFPTPPPVLPGDRLADAVRHGGAIARCLGLAHCFGLAVRVRIGVTVALAHSVHDADDPAAAASARDAGLHRDLSRPGGGFAARPDGHR